MAHEQENNQIRRRPRSRQRRRRQPSRLLLLLAAILTVAVLIAAGVLLVLLLRPGAEPAPTQPTIMQTQPTAPQPTQPKTTITLAFGGDLNITDNVVSAGDHLTHYDYTDLLLDIAPILAGADASVINLEGTLYGQPYGGDSASAPPELMDALAAAGVDFIQMANSYSIYNGLSGLRQTLAGIRQAGMEPLGAYANNEEFEQNRGFTLRNINGVKVAFVSFTKGMEDGLRLPSGSEHCVNLLYKDYTSTYSDIDEEGITAILRDVALEEPDVTIALLHWGSAYNGIVSDSQKKIVKLMQKEGVDAIIGNHSHYVQEVQYDQEKGTLVAYSLGDLLGDAKKANTNASTILQLQITKDPATGKTTISGYDHTPIYIATTQTDGVTRTKVLRIRDAMAAYEANSIHKVSETTYTAMKTALSRIVARIKPED